MAARFDAEERRLRSRASAEVGKAMSRFGEEFVDRRRRERASQGNVMAGAGALGGGLVGARAAKWTSARAWRPALLGGLVGFTGVKGASEVAASAEERRIRGLYDRVGPRGFRRMVESHLSGRYT